MTEQPGLGTGAVARLTDVIAIQDFPNEPEYNYVLWWHVCSTQPPLTGLWVPSGLSKHTITGSVAAGDLNVSPSILCKNCGRHGFIENMVWRDA